MSIISNSSQSSSPTLAPLQMQAPFSFTGAVFAKAQEIINEFSVQRKTTSLKDRFVVPASLSMIKITSLLARALSNESSKDVSERVLLRKIDQLCGLLCKLELAKTKEEVVNFWKTMDADLTSILSEGICYAHRLPVSYEPICKNYIENYPGHLLQVATSRGENLIKRLILELEEIGKTNQSSAFLYGGQFTQEMRSFSRETMGSWGMQLIEVPQDGSFCLLGNAQKLNGLFHEIFTFISETVQELELTETQRVQLAHSFVEKGRGEHFWNNIDHFNITNQTVRIDILKLCVSHLHSTLKVSFGELIEKVCQIENPRWQEQQLVWLAHTLSLLTTFSVEQLLWVKDKDF